MSEGRSRARRIVFLDNFPRVGGAEQNLLDLLARLDRRRFAPFLVTSEEGQLARETRRFDVPVLFCRLPERVSVISRTVLGVDSLAGVLGQLLPYLRRLARTLHRVRPHLVYSNAMKDHCTAAFLAPVLRRPVVWHFMDFLEKPLLRHFVEMLGSSPAVRLITNSVFTARQFPRLLCRPGKVQPIYEGLDLAETDRKRKLEPERRLPERKGPVIAIVGAVCPEKGQELLIRCLPDLTRRVPGLSCWIVGEEIYVTSRHRPGFRSNLEMLARDLGVLDAVHFLGWRNDIIAVVERIDVMVGATDPRLSTETFGRTLVEAMACEKPVVAVARGGPCEIVQDGVTGILLKDYSAEALAAAVLRLAGDADHTRKMGLAGRRRVEGLFTIEKYVDGVEHCFERVLGSRHRVQGE